VFLVDFIVSFLTHPATRMVIRGLFWSLFTVAVILLVYFAGLLAVGKLASMAAGG